MTLVNTVLEKLAEWRPSSDERQTLVLPDLRAGWSVRVIADQQNEIGCRVREIEAYRSPTAVPSGAPGLRQRSQLLAEQVRSLREVLQVLEVDDTRDQALLRSQEPALRDGAIAYFEVLVHGSTRVQLRRYQAAHADARREQVVFSLTHEVLADLVVGVLVD